MKARLTGEDIFYAHRLVKCGLYRSEDEIWKREADILNLILERRNRKLRKKRR